MTKHYALLGHPVHHSLSPAMHQAAFRAAGLDATYVARDVPSGELSQTIDALRRGELDGANVTAPHKASVLALVDEADAEARLLGAANTLLRVGHSVFATNTDAHGLALALDEFGVRQGLGKVVVVGAGGAARAAVVSALRRGATRVEVLARRASAAEALAHHLRGRAGDGEVVPGSFPEDLAQTLDGAALLIQATGATAGLHEKAFVDAFPLERLPKDAIVVDLVYAPRETRLLVHAAARALSAHNGISMLLHQGALSFERWTGVDAPLGAMKHALMLKE